jgi:hypothetical protein
MLVSAGAVKRGVDTFGAWCRQSLMNAQSCGRQWRLAGAIEESWNLALVILVAAFLARSSSGSPAGNDDDEKAIASIPADEVTRNRLRVIRVAVSAAKDRLQSMAANIRYSVDEFDPQRKPYHPKSSRGELVWFRGRTKYFLLEPSNDSRVHLGVVRDGGQLVRARWVESRAIHAFDILPPVTTAAAWFMHREVYCSLIDPLILCGGLVPSIWNNPLCVKMESSEDEEGITVISTNKHGNRAIDRFSRQWGYLPVLREVRTPVPAPNFLALRMSSEWARVGGIVVPSRVEFNEYLPNTPPGRATHHKEVVYSEVTVNRPEHETAVRFETMPLPDGTKGYDQRVTPGRPVVFSRAGVRPDSQTRATSKVAEKPRATDPGSLSDDEQRFAKAAERERWALYYRWGAIGLACLSAASAIGFLAVRLRGRRQDI